MFWSKFLKLRRPRFLSFLEKWPSFHLSLYPHGLCRDQMGCFADISTESALDCSPSIRSSFGQSDVTLCACACKHSSLYLLSANDPFSEFLRRKLCAH